jgi:hypothetical protein
MPRTLIGILLFILLTATALAVQHTSGFGFHVDIPTGWLVFSQEELKANPDLFDLDSPALKKINPQMLEQISDKIKSGSIEIYINPSAGSTTFADNINTLKQIGQLPVNPADTKTLCAQIPDELSQAFGKLIKLYQCKHTMVGGRSAMLMEFDGVIDNTRSIQYQVQKSDNVLLIITGTFKLETLEQERPVFSGIAQSIRFQ